MTIAGPGAGTVTVDAGSATQIITIANGVTASITGLTFDHGRTSYGNGGAITAASNTTVTIGNCVFLNDQAIYDAAQSTDPGYGGAIYSNGSLTVNACVFQSDQANNGGGAIAANDATTLNVTDCTFTTDTLRGTAAPSSPARQHRNDSDRDHHRLELHQRHGAEHLGRRRHLLGRGTGA